MQQQCASAVQWMRSGIPKISGLIASLAVFLTGLFEDFTRTKSSFGWILLCDMGWGSYETPSFNQCKSGLENQVTLGYHDTTSDCVISGILGTSFGLAWSHKCIMRTSVRSISTNFIYTWLLYQIIFLVSNSNGTPSKNRRSRSWQLSTACIGCWKRRNAWKYSRTITTAYTCLFHCQSSPPYQRNSFARSFDKTFVSMRKMIRGLKSKGIDFFWADLLGRWSDPARICRIFHIWVLSSSSADDFEWTSSVEVQFQEYKYSATRPSNCVLYGGSIENPSAAVWIAYDSVSLQLFL